MLFDIEKGYVKTYLLNSNIDDSVSFYNKDGSLLCNEKNNKEIHDFLGKKYLPLRHTYIYDIKIITTFVKLIHYLDLPYRFDSKINNL